MGGLVEDLFLLKQVWFCYVYKATDYINSDSLNPSDPQRDSVPAPWRLHGRHWGSRPGNRAERDAWGGRRSGRGQRREGWARLSARGGHLPTGSHLQRFCSSVLQPRLLRWGKAAPEQGHRGGEGPGGPVPEPRRWGVTTASDSAISFFTVHTKIMYLCITAP